MKSELPVLICYSRSGGTLINQILGSLENVIVLSEVNPWGSFKPMLEQAEEWFSLINAEEKRDLEGRSFAEQIRELERKAKNKYKKLIIRDWSAANFMKGLIKKKSPSHRLETIESLKDQYLLKPLVIVRDPYSTWKSNYEKFEKYFDLRPRQFFSGYYKYLITIRDIPRIRLEDFTTYPSEYMRWVCGYWGITFDENVFDKYGQFTRCTGDNTLAKSMTNNSKINKVTVVPWAEDMDIKTRKELKELYQLTSYECS